MADSRSGSKLIIAVLAVAVLGLTVALILSLRDPAPEVAAAPPAAEAPAAPMRTGEGAGSGGFAQARQPSLPGGPPARARNELGQPLDENGRPIGPPHKLQTLRNRAIAEGELPMTPPRFDDPAQRAQFKAWWVDEFSRRVAIFETLEPGDYPSAEDTAALLEDMYDAGEPRSPGESVEDAMNRRRQFRTHMRHFLDVYGVPPYTVVTRAGDPQYGQPSAPPLQPPGVSDEPVVPAEPSEMTPPGRGADDPGGTDPVNPNSGPNTGPGTRDGAEQGGAR
ncbi:hypothetical protein [Haliangium ochraceum]|uniref:Uncharacterized protein n=1 Tax=Haliangium ochraceum (strain DSM 14365 / JCM 11303 / SMP-2) TaxID=502025 RepID=D0LJ24_HALO1|nr:hypothetical protein [Haliangium ochraceum]ACY13053.1 hypothetical protein Hoch_0412 [Haliangium ochraceum DSM 14365]